MRYIRLVRSTIAITALVVGFCTTRAAGDAVAAPLVYLRDIGSAGSGPTQYVGAAGIGTDAQGNLYVADGLGNKILKYSGTGVYLGSWGSGGSGPSQFDEPFDVAVLPDGTIFVSDAGNRRVQVFDSSLAFLRAWSTPGSPQFLGASESPYIYFNSGPYMYKYNLDGSPANQWPYTSNITTVSHGFGIAAGDTLFITDGSLVRKFTSTGTEALTWGGLGDGDGQFNGAVGAVVDGEGRVHVSDGAGRIQVFTLNGIFLFSWGESKLTGGAPDLATDGSGNVFVLNGNRILEFGKDPTSTRPIRLGQLKSRYR